MGEISFLEPFDGNESTNRWDVLMDGNKSNKSPEPVATVHKFVWHKRTHFLSSGRDIITIFFSDIANTGIRLSNGQGSWKCGPRFAQSDVIGRIEFRRAAGQGVEHVSQSAYGFFGGRRFTVQPMRLANRTFATLDQVVGEQRRRTGVGFPRSPSAAAAPVRPPAGRFNHRPFYERRYLW